MTRLSLVMYILFNHNRCKSLCLIHEDLMIFMYVFSFL